MVEPLGIAREIGERRLRLAAKQSPSVAARLVSGPYARQTDEVLRLNAENANLRKQVEVLQSALNLARETLTNVAQPRCADTCHDDAMRIVGAMAAAFGVKEHQILARLRTAPVVQARVGAMLAMRRCMGWSYRHIGVQLQRDESSVRLGIRKATHLHNKSEPWANRYHDAVNRILPRMSEAA